MGMGIAGGRKGKVGHILMIMSLDQDELRQSDVLGGIVT